MSSALHALKKADGFYLEMTLAKAWRDQRPRVAVTASLLGKAAIPDQSYEQPDGAPIRIDIDYAGRERPERNPFPGPFEPTGDGRQTLKVW